MTVQVPLPLLPAVTSTVGTYLSMSELLRYNHFGYNPGTHLQHSGPGLTFLLLTGLTQNVEELLKSDTARLMLANSEFLILLNQASTDREELAALLNISENQLSYITNVSVGSGLIRCSGNIVPFENTFPKNTDLYKLMTTKPGES